jgi:class 3 adenylate cyclase/tetratricopeptide (TPR) repeat protein
VDFVAVMEQAIALLRQRGRVTYRTLQIQFTLDDEQLAALKDELLYSQPQVRDDTGRGLLWTDDSGPVLGGTAAPVAPPAQAPLTYTPPYLAEKILTSRSALEGERKQVTVLFADLKGSMELLADRDPEEARQLLDPVLERMMAAVHRYEGTVNQVMGDGIMALFGAPLAHEDHAVRACYAALGMQAAVQQYATEVQRTYGVPLQMRVGLNAGEVVVRAIGNDLHMDYSAIGQTTHLAARMEQMAMPGTILLTPAVVDLANGFIQVTPIGPVPIKGLDAPVEVFELVGATALRRRLQTAVARGLSPFVGRQPELEALQQALARAGASQGQVVALLGEPGVGKSRLVYEFLHSHSTQGWLRLESGSVSYGKATAYLPVCDLLKAYCQIEDRDDLRTVRAKITGHILTLDETLQDTVPAILALFEALPPDSPFLHLDPLQRRRRTLEALKRLLLRESQVQPLLLVFEDLHWIDSETQAVLDMLVESLPTARVLLLVNYRPEYQHGWGSKTFYTQLRLDPLPEASADTLLQALLGPEADLASLTQLLIARTQGNPFFLEESVRTLVETGVLVGDRGAYRLAKPLDAWQVPATVQALLAARIDRLPPEEKRLLQTAAVIGTEVPWPLLQAIAELPEEVLHGGLAHLQAAEFLYETRLFPEREYTFKHALTHEVAYSSLLLERRRVLHAGIVVALEALTPDRVAEQVERLAHHAVRGELWAKALAYCRQAGEKVLARSAYREAAGYFEQALSALPHLPEQRATREQAIDLRLALRVALWPSGNAGRILAYLHEAEALAAALDDPRRLGQVSLFLSALAWVLGTHDQAITSGQRALALATTCGDAILHALANYYLGFAYHAQGDYRRAIDCHSQTVASLDGARRRERFGLAILPAVFAHANLAAGHAELGLFAEGRGLGDEGLGIAEAVDHPGSLMVASWGVGLLALRQGDLPRALPRLERALGLCQEASIPALFPAIAAALGAAYTLDGRGADAVPLLTQATEQAMAMERVDTQARCRLSLGEAQLLAGRLEEAQTLAEQALAQALERQERGNQAYALHLLGDIAARRHPPESERRRLLPPSPRPGRRTRHAPAPGPLSPGPR